MTTLQLRLETTTRESIPRATAPSSSSSLSTQRNWKEGLPRFTRQS